MTSKTFGRSTSLLATHSPLGISDADLDSVPLSAHASQDEKVPLVAAEHVIPLIPLDSALVQDREAWHGPTRTKEVVRSRSLIDATPRAAHTWWRHSPYFSGIALFLLAEVSFLILATVSWFRVVWVPESTNEHFVTLIRGVFNIVFIAWHTLALVPLLAVIDFVYSSEWSHVYHRDRDTVTPDDVDPISSLDGGWLDRARYLISHRPSNTFRLTFVAALLCTALTGVGPSVFSVLPSTVSYDGTLKIANITTLGLLAREGINSSAAVGRAADFFALALSNPDIVLEQPRIETGYPDSLDPSVSALVPQPFDPVSPRVNVSYLTDAILFQHTCDWYIPTWNTANGRDSAVFDGQSDWTVPTFPGHRWAPWVPASVPEDITAGIFPLVELPAAEDSLPSTAFLFLGTNTSLSTPEFISLDLQHTPSSYRDEGFPLKAAQQAASTAFTTNLASILLCDPSMERISTIVQAVTIPAWTMLTFGEPVDMGPVGNLSPDAAAAMMSGILSLAATFQAADGPDMPGIPRAYVGTLSMVAFVDSNGTGPYSMDRNTREIAASFDQVFATVGRTFLDGYMGPNSPKSTFLTSSTRFVEVQRLTVNISLLAATCALIAAIATLLTVAANLPSARNRQPLNVKTVLEIAGETTMDGDTSGPDQRENHVQVRCILLMGVIFAATSVFSL